LTPAKPKASSHHSAQRLAKNRHGDDSVDTPAGSALASNVNSAAEGVTNSPDGANSRSDGPPASPATGTAPTAGTSEATQQQPTTAAPARQEPVASDSRITADAKAQIATTAPDSAIDVTTTDGVIALAGSVPSKDVAERARQAALRVAGVKDVDASALKVSDQLR
jgi:hyperosmotically inducible protein